MKSKSYTSPRFRYGVAASESNEITFEYSFSASKLFPTEVRRAAWLNLTSGELGSSSAADWNSFKAADVSR